MQEQQEQALSGAFREGTSEFDAVTRRIVAETNEDKTWFSPVGTGGIMMNIAGRIRNNGDKVITGLEIRVSVVDIGGKVVKENTLVVVPNQKKTLAPKEQMDVTVRIDGFRQDDDRANIRWKLLPEIRNSSRGIG
jgi:hypothetical protein